MKKLIYLLIASLTLFGLTGICYGAKADDAERRFNDAVNSLTNYGFRYYPVPLSVFSGKIGKHESNPFKDSHPKFTIVTRTIDGSFTRLVEHEKMGVNLHCYSEFPNTYPYVIFVPDLPPKTQKIIKEGMTLKMILIPSQNLVAAYSEIDGLTWGYPEFELVAFWIITGNREQQNRTYTPRVINYNYNGFNKKYEI